MNDYDTDIGLRLNQDFLFILSLSTGYLNNFANDPEKNQLCKNWLDRLCIQLDNGNNEKRIRNTYLCKLCVCMQNKRLSGPFLQNPPAGDLAPLTLPPITDKAPFWVKELIKTARDDPNNMFVQGGKDCRTYLATKLLDNNRGACAYIGLSVTDEGEIPHWTRMGTGDEIDRKYRKFFLAPQSNSTSFLKDYYSYLLDALHAELNGSSVNNPDLNKVCQVFIEDPANKNEVAFIQRTQANRRIVLLNLIKVFLVKKMDSISSDMLWPQELMIDVKVDPYKVFSANIDDYSIPDGSLDSLGVLEDLELSAHSSITSAGFNSSGIHDIKDLGSDDSLGLLDEISMPSLGGSLPSMNSSIGSPLIAHSSPKPTTPSQRSPKKQSPEKYKTPEKRSTDYARDLSPEMYQKHWTPPQQ